MCSFTCVRQSRVCSVDILEGLIRSRHASFWFILTRSHSKRENILSVIFDVSYSIIILSTFQHNLIKNQESLDHINMENYNLAGKT